MTSQPTCGTDAGYRWHYRRRDPKCQPCWQAHSQRVKLNKATQQTYFHPAAAAQRHLRRLNAAGMSWVAIGRQVGLSPDTIRLIAAGEHKKMTRHTAVKIAASRVDLAPGAFIDSTGTVRRIKALLALGWTHAHLGQHTGLATSPIIHQRNGRVTVRTAQTVSETFERLCMTPGPSPLTRQRALNMGYHVPLAWDDIDDPDAAPAGGVPAPVDEVKVQRAVAGHRVDLNRDEREAAQTILEARGMCAREIAERVGRTPRTIVRRRSDRAA